MVDTGLGQGACQGLGTEWAVLTNEVSEVESRKYLQERQADGQAAGVHDRSPETRKECLTLRTQGAESSSLWAGTHSL